MAKAAAKKVSFLVERGVRINGESIHPSKDAKKPVIITLPESFARELVHASKGKIVSQNATKAVAEKTDDDDLDDAFGADADAKE
jgi:hypothetical protein